MACNVGRLQEGSPRKLVDVGVIRAAGVGGGHADVVARVADIAVNQQAAADGIRHRLFYGIHHPLGRLRVSTDRTDVGFEY